jgi:hypothetical protein
VPTELSPPASQISHWETPLVFIGLLIFFSINLFTATVSPIPWGDEVMLSDPAIRWHLGQGFTSAAWAVQGKDQFFSANVPLYAVLLKEWIGLFGLTLTSIRSFSYACYFLAIGLLWLATVRFGLLRSCVSRLAVVLLLCTAFGMTFMYRNARYDALGVLLVSIVFIFLTAPSVRLSRVGILITGIFFPFAGLQLLPFILAIGLATLISVRPAPTRPLISLALGCSVGTVLLCALYLAQGTFGIFVQSALGCGVYFKTDSIGYFSKLISLPSAFLGNPFELWQTDRMDYSSLIVFLLILLLALTDYHRSRLISYPARFALLVSILVPLFMHLSAHFRIYYRWMTFIPCCICLLMILERLWNYISWRFRIVIVMALIGAMIIGLPARLAYFALSSGERNYATLKSLVAHEILPSDRIYSNGPAYFAAIAFNPHVLSEGYLLRMTPEEKNQITLLAVSPDKFDEVQAHIPGPWIKACELLPRSSAILGGYRVAFYRRH